MMGGKGMMPPNMMGMMNPQMMAQKGMMQQKGGPGGPGMMNPQMMGMMGGKGGPGMMPMGGMMGAKGVCGMPNPQMMAQKGQQMMMQKGGPGGPNPGQQMPPQGQQPQGQPGAGGQGAPLNASALAAAPPSVQKQMIGEKLYPAIARLQPAMAGKITGMMLEMDNSELLILLESEPQLKNKVDEAVRVLDTQGK